MDPRGLAATWHPNVEGRPAPTTAPPARLPLPGASIRVQQGQGQPGPGPGPTSSPPRISALPALPWWSAFSRAELGPHATAFLRSMIEGGQGLLDDTCSRMFMKAPRTWPFLNFTGQWVAHHLRTGAMSDRRPGESTRRPPRPGRLFPPPAPVRITRSSRASRSGTAGRGLMFSVIAPRGTDAVVAEHAHPHDRWTSSSKGGSSSTVGGVTSRLGPGDIWHIPGGVAPGVRIASTIPPSPSDNVPPDPGRRESPGLSRGFPLNGPPPAGVFLIGRLHRERHLILILPSIPAGAGRSASAMPGSVLRPRAPFRRRSTNNLGAVRHWPPW